MAVSYVVFTESDLLQLGNTDHRALRWDNNLERKFQTAKTKSFQVSATGDKERVANWEFSSRASNVTIEIITLPREKNTELVSFQGKARKRLF